MQNIIEKIKNPVNTCLEKVKAENINKGLIKGAIIAVIMTIISTISQIISIFTRYWNYYYYRDFSERMETVWSQIEDEKIFSGILQNIIITAVVIAIVALILLIIAKAVKSSRKYEEMLSIVNNVTIILGIGQVIQIVVSLIYAPLGMIVSVAVSIYALLTLIETFKQCIDVDESDTLVLVTTGVITAAVAIVMLLLTGILKSSLGDIGTALNFMNIM